MFKAVVAKGRELRRSSVLHRARDNSIIILFDKQISQIIITAELFDGERSLVWRPAQSPRPSASRACETLCKAAERRAHALERHARGPTSHCHWRLCRAPLGTPSSTAPLKIKPAAKPPRAVRCPSSGCFQGRAPQARARWMKACREALPAVLRDSPRRFSRRAREMEAWATRQST